MYCMVTFGGSNVKTLAFIVLVYVEVKKSLFQTIANTFQTKIA